MNQSEFNYLAMLDYISFPMIILQWLDTIEKISMNLQ